MESKKKTILMVVIVAIIIASSVYFLSQSESNSGLKVHYYKDGVEVFIGNLLSVINVDTSNYDEISFEIIGENIGEYLITNMQVVDAGPIEFKNSIPTIPKTLASGETKILWISDRIDVHQFESLPQPIKFWVNISGESPYIVGKIYDYIDLDLDFGSILFDYTEEQLIEGVSVDLWNGVMLGQQKTIINNRIKNIGVKLSNFYGTQYNYDATIKIIRISDNLIIDEAPIQNLNIIPQGSEGDWYYANFDSPQLINGEVFIVVDFTEGQLPDWNNMGDGQTISVRAGLNIIDGEMMNGHFKNSFYLDGYGTNLFDRYGWMPGLVSNEALDMVYKISYSSPEQSPITILNSEDFTNTYYNDLTYIRYDFVTSGIQVSSCYAKAIDAYKDPYTGARDLSLSCNIRDGVGTVSDSLPNRMIEGDHNVEITVVDSNGKRWKAYSILRIDKSPPVITLTQDISSMQTCEGGYMTKFDLTVHVSDSLSGIDESKLKYKVEDFPTGDYDSGWLPMQYSGVDGIYTATLIPSQLASCNSWLNMEATDKVGNIGVYIK